MVAKIIRTLYFQQHRDLIWSSSVCLEWHEETEQTETDSIQKNCANVSKMLQETYLLEVTQIHILYQLTSIN